MDTSLLPLLRLLPPIPHQTMTLTGDDLDILTLPPPTPRASSAWVHNSFTFSICHSLCEWQVESFLSTFTHHQEWDDPLHCTALHCTTQHTHPITCIFQSNLSCRIRIIPIFSISTFILIPFLSFPFSVGLFSCIDGYASPYCPCYFWYFSFIHSLQITS